MADKMVVEDKELAASLLPALPPPVTTKKTNKKAPPLPAVQLVSLWALLTVAIFLLSSFVVAPLLISVPPSWVPAGAELTDAEAAEVCAIFQGLLWCSAAAAATAALALLLPDRRCCRSRRVLACVALAATATIHLMLARATTLVFATDLGNIFWWILATVDASFLAAGDIICILALLGRGAYANVPAG